MKPWHVTPPEQATSDVLKVIESVPGSNRAAIISLSGWGRNSVHLAIKMLVGKGLVTSKAQPVPRSDGRNRTVPTYYAQHPPAL